MEVQQWQIEELTKAVSAMREELTTLAFRVTELEKEQNVGRLKQLFNDPAMLKKGKKK